MKSDVQGKVKILVRDSYLARIQGALGTKMFRHLYASVDGTRVDILDDGDRSCALFVSTVLVGLHLAHEVHASVEATVRDMEYVGWKPIRSPRAGCIVVWDAVNAAGHAHHHIGFYMRPRVAISNSSRTKVPTEHPYRAHPVHALYWHSKLE